MINKFTESERAHCKAICTNEIEAGDKVHLRDGSVLVECEEVLKIYANRDLFVGSFYPSGHSEAEKMLAKLHAAGIGR